MGKQRLIEYLRDVFELEKQKNIAQNTMEYMAKEYNEAKGNFEEGQKIHKVKMKGFHYICLGLCIYFAIVGVAGVSMLSNPNVSVDMMSILISFIVAIVCGFIYLHSYKKKRDEQIKVNAMATVLGQKGEKDMAVLNKNYQMILKIYNENEKTLEKLYSFNIIYPKYRYLEACGMFLEYLMAGRTCSLETCGNDQGAYNIYEDEMFKGTIINKLDQVLSNQRILIDGQKQISEQINTLIYGVDEMRKNVNDIKISVQTNTFCNAVTAFNTAVIRKIIENQYYR